MFNLLTMLRISSGGVEDPPITPASENYGLSSPLPVPTPQPIPLALFPLGCCRGGSLTLTRMSEET